MKKILFAACLVGLGACSPDTMVGISPDQSISLMRGTGSASRSPSGETTYRYVIPANAYAGTINDAATLRKQHEFLIASWIGSEKICPTGYTIDEPSNEQGMIIYTGTCSE